MISLKDQAIQNALAGEWQKAVAINKSLLKEDPQDIDALNRLAFAFSILGKTKDAKTAYQKVLKIDSLNPLALRNLKRIASSKKIKNYSHCGDFGQRVNSLLYKQSFARIWI